jgi:thiol-disulfide isomerase/thioredoxin
VPLLRLKPPPLRKAGPKAVVSVAAVAAVLLAGGLSLAFTGGGGLPAGESYLDGNQAAVVYKAGYRPAVPDFSGTTLGGGRVSLAAYRGKVLVLNFWGSWCAPCQAEGPTLAALSRKYSGHDVAFLGVDFQDTPVNADAFEQGYGITYPSINDPGGAVSLAISRAVPTIDTPTTLVIDPAGHLAGAIRGTAAYSVLNSMLSEVTG